MKKLFVLFMDQVIELKNSYICPPTPNIKYLFELRISNISYLCKLMLLTIPVQILY